MPLLALAVRQRSRRAADRDTRTGARRRRTTAARRRRASPRYPRCPSCCAVASARSAVAAVARRTWHVHVQHSQRLHAGCVAGARAVHLGDDDPLPLAEHRLAGADLQRDAVAEQHGAQVRVGVHAIAVRVLRVVVHPLGVAIDHLLEHPGDVRVQRLLRLVDDERAGRVHRPQAGHPLPHAALADQVHDHIGDVDQLDAPVGLHQHGIGMDDEGTRYGGGLHGCVPDGQTRALGHQLGNCTCSRVRGFAVRGRSSRTARSCRSCGSRTCGPRRTRGPAASRAILDLNRLSPAAKRSGCESHAVPPL